MVGMDIGTLAATIAQKGQAMSAATISLFTLIVGEMIYSAGEGANSVVKGGDRKDFGDYIGLKWGGRPTNKDKSRAAATYRVVERARHDGHCLREIYCVLGRRTPHFPLKLLWTDEYGSRRV